MADSQRRAVELYRELGPAVYRRCLEQLRDPEVAKDATLDAFVKLLRDPRRLESRETALPWIDGVAAKHCQHVRRVARRHGQELPPPEPARGDGAPAPEEPAGAGCPSELALEAYLLDRERAAATAHVAGCERCARRVARMEEEGETFRREVLPETVDWVEHAAAPKPWWRARTWMVPVPAVLLSLAALGFLLNAERVPVDEPAGAKGSLALTVLVGEGDGARAVADGGEVPLAAPLRFTVRPPEPCRLWLASVDGAGQVSRLYPAEGDRGATLAQGGSLPGGAALDGKPGPERIYAVCTPEPVDFLELERAIGAAVRAGGGLEGARAVSGMPGGTSQASVLVHERP